MSADGQQEQYGRKKEGRKEEAVGKEERQIGTSEERETQCNKGRQEKERKIERKKRIVTVDAMIFWPSCGGKREGEEKAKWSDARAKVDLYRRRFGRTAGKEWTRRIWKKRGSQVSPKALAN